MPPMIAALPAPSNHAGFMSSFERTRCTRLFTREQTSKTLCAAPPPSSSRMTTSARCASSLARIGVAAHGLDGLNRCLGPADSLDDFSENFGVAGDLTHQRNGAAVFVGQTVDVVRLFNHVAPAPVLISDLFRDAAMMIVFRADDRDIEPLFGEPLDHAIELLDERADQIVEQIDAARDQALLRLLDKSMKTKHQAVAGAQRGHVAHNRKLAQAGIIGQQPCLAALDARERIELAAGILVSHGERGLGERPFIHLAISPRDAQAEADARR